MSPPRLSSFDLYQLPAYQALLHEPGITLTNNSRAGAADYAAWLECALSRWHVIYNGVVDADRPAPAEVRACRDALLPAGRHLVGGMLSLSPQKRPRLWVETAAAVARMMPSAGFALFGTGRLQAEVQALARARGLQERLQLRGPVEDAALALSAFDLTLLTSDYEGTPNVLLESQWLGVPVIAAGRGGVGEAMEHGVTGLHLPEAGASELARAIVGLLRDEPRLRRMQAAGPAFVRGRFGAERMVDETLALYGRP
jgi:glycosyltransferase involved in cell wall biosynthesis